MRVTDDFNGLEQWIRQNRPEFAARVDAEIENARQRVDELLGIKKSTDLLPKRVYTEAVNGTSQGRNGKWTPQWKSIKIPRAGTLSEKIFIWLIIADGNTSIVHRVLKNDPDFVRTKELPQHIREVAKKAGFKRIENPSD